jgi:hypothetical protein
MFNKTFILLFIMTFGLNAYASTSVPVSGMVESKCVVTQDVIGVFGNPTPGVLSTDPADGGVNPVVRFDVVQASYYTAKISHPDTFTESPALNDVVYWTGSASVDQVTDANMSSYDTDKVEYNNVTEFFLTIAGSTWFAVESEATYGVGRALPGGQYQAAVLAECIAI